VKLGGCLLGGLESTLARDDDDGCGHWVGWLVGEAQLLYGTGTTPVLYLYLHLALGGWDGMG